MKRVADHRTPPRICPKHEGTDDAETEHAQVEDE